MKFSVNKIPDIVVKSMSNLGIWKKESPVTFDRLKLLEISHYNFSGNISVGQLVVLDKIASAILDIFKELFALKFPIHSIKLIDEFSGDDMLSMEANNTSAFNYRPIINSTELSMHSYGLAIDINPLQNPFIVIDNESKVEIFPKQGVNFLNRTNIREGMVEQIVHLFKKHGFEWGGNWNSPIDYHHFQMPRAQVIKLIS